MEQKAYTQQLSDLKIQIFKLDGSRERSTGTFEPFSRAHWFSNVTTISIYDDLIEKTINIMKKTHKLSKRTKSVGTLAPL